jgi:DNA-binding SARP family transcriptional activator
MVSSAGVPLGSGPIARAMLEFRILGPLEALDGGHRLTIASGRERALLTLLLIHANAVVPTDRILDEIWGEASPESGAKTVAFHVSRLRDALCPGRRKGDGCAALRTESGGYRLQVEPDAVDAQRFESLASEGRAQLRTDPAAARELLAAALSLWRGEALTDVRYEPFAQPEIQRLEELRLRTVEDRFEADLALGDDGAAIGDIEGQLASCPLRERLRGQLMTALYRAGRQAEALRVYEEGRRLLAEELGIEPSPDLEGLQLQILRQDARLSGTASERRRNPYKGLRAFAEDDRADFYGREALVGRLVERVAEVARNGRLMAMVGPSGSGKSSVVRAGLVPALRAGSIPGSEHWKIELMCPGADPYRELASALDHVAGRPDPGRRRRLERNDGLAGEVAAVLGADAGLLLLVVDQFEELFALVADEGRRARFLNSLAAALSGADARLILVATLRADALDQALRLPPFGELVRTGAEIVTPLAGDELERAIIRPAQSVGVELEPGLVTEVISDVARQPGELPLLQYALTELFERSDGRHLTRDGYAAIGGVLGALSRRADEVYQGLNRNDKETARHVLLRLVAADENDRPVSRRATRSELRGLVDGASAVEHVLDALGRGRLLAFDRDPTTGEATVAVAHEALLSHWPRLAGWVEQARDDIRMGRQLAGAAAEWEASGRDGDYLLTGGRLEAFAAWATAATVRLDPAERALLDASVAEQRRRQAADETRLAHERALERRAAFRLRALVAVLLVALLVSTSLSVAVYYRGEQASEGADVAVARELAAASIASLDRDPDLSLLLAVRAADATADRGYVVEEATEALQWALQGAHAAFPSDELPVGAAAGPHGWRGMTLLPPNQLMAMAVAAARRPMSTEECRTFLHATCPPPARAPTHTLLVDTGADRVPVEQLATATLEGTRVDLAVALPARLGPLLEPVLAAFEQQTGISVVIADGAALDPRGRVQSGAADIAILDHPGDVARLARDGHLVDLEALADLTTWRGQAGAYLASLGTFAPDGRWPSTQGTLYAAPIATEVSSLVWYPKAAFDRAGYKVPTTWSELVSLTNRIVADGRIPWCLGTESGEAAADIVEDIVIARAGPDLYDGWAVGRQRFDPGPVRDAFAEFGELVGQDDRVVNGTAAVADIPEAMAGLPLFTDPPGCWLHAGSATERLGWPATSTSLVSAFPFPADDPSGSTQVRGRVYEVVATHDRPEVRLLVRYLLGGGFVDAAASAFEPEGLSLVGAPDPQHADTSVIGLERDLTLRGLRSGTFRADASDVMPVELRSAFSSGMLTYLARGSYYLEPLLASLDKTRTRVTP